MRKSSTPLDPSRGRRRRLAALVTTALVVALAPAVVAGAPATADDKAPKGAAHGYWKKLAGTPAATKNGKPAEIRAASLSTFALDRAELAADLATAPEEGTRAARRAPLVVSLPAPDGVLQRFSLQESSVMEPGLAAAHPEITTYAGKGIDDPTASIRADLTPVGFHASVLSPRGAWYVDPLYKQDQSVYATYYARDLNNPEGAFEEREDVAATASALEAGVASAAEEVPVGPAVKLRTYRLALITDPSYAAYHGAGNVTAAKVTLVNRVTQIYEDEMAVRLVLIDDTDKTNLDTEALALEPNGPCGSAPCYTSTTNPTTGETTTQFDVGCTGGLLNRNRIVLGQIIGASNYDIGHIGLGQDGGGIAGLRVVGGDGKARGCTGLSTPVGDFFAVDYVAHEMGHQFGGNHTFNGTQHNCGGNKAAPSVEPGSGSSIMAYAGICRHDNLQPHSDPYWSQWSFQEINTYINSSVNPINEVQTVSLTGFDGTDSFTLSLDGATTAPIVRGVNYTTAGIKAALEAVLPAGSIVTVAAWGGGGALNDTGFQVTFGAASNNLPQGTLGRADQNPLVLSATGASGFVGETAKGGPIDNAGHTVVENGNHAPVVTTPGEYTIPVQTPFALTGSATDSDGDSALTYMWEQKDRGGGQGTALVNNTKTNGPLFRQFGTAALVTPEGTLQTPSPGLNQVGTDPTRVFPDLAQILANNTNAEDGTCDPFTGVWPETVPLDDVECYSEFLPTPAYLGQPGVNAAPASLNFRLTVRDGRPGGGGVGNSDTRLILAPTAGPFVVTSDAAGADVLAGPGHAVTWDVAGTNLAPVSTENVKISLSLDGGWTYPHVLAETTANDGSETVTIPDVQTETARIKVEALGNVYFDVSAADFTIRGSAVQLEELVTASTGVGPGTALADKARSAVASHAAGSTASTCSTLASYIELVRAQVGKKVSAAQATALIDSATRIRSVIGC